MWIPTKLYEALPAIYVTVGVALIIGTLYVGFDRGFMMGYLAVGLVCIAAGIAVRSIRNDVRSGRDDSRP